MIAQDDAWYDEDAGPLVRSYATVDEDAAGEHGLMELFVGNVHDARLTDACRPRPGGEASYPTLMRLLTGLRAL